MVGGRVGGARLERVGFSEVVKEERAESRFETEENFLRVRRAGTLDAEEEEEGWGYVGMGIVVSARPGAGSGCS